MNGGKVYKIFKDAGIIFWYTTVTKFGVSIILCNIILKKIIILFSMDELIWLEVIRLRFLQIKNLIQICHHRNKYI